MNLLVNNLVEELIIGTKRSLQSKEYFLKKKSEEKLMNILLNELTKPSIDQSKTPTQIVNDFLYKEFTESFTLTPYDFGEKAHKLIIEWGIQKPKDMNEQ